MAMTRRQIQEFQEKKRAIEEDTLKSSEDSLRILRDTQKCGVATAEELNRQGDQLKKIDRQLDDINGTLIKSQKNINGMKSMFSGFTSLFGRKATSETDIYSNEVNIKISEPKPTPQEKTVNSNNLKLPDNYTSSMSQQHLNVDSTFDSRLNTNMREMSKSLTMLKSLAIDMGQEIDSQNVLIDGITRKTDEVDLKIQHQNKQMKKILGK